MEQLNEYDQLQLDDFRLAKEETHALKEQLEDELAALEAQHHELEEEKAEMERLMAEKQAKFEDYEVMLAQARQQAAVYSANIKNQTDQIKKLARKEAEVKAQEVAAVKAAEEARQRANAGSSNTSSAGGNYAAPSSFSGSTGQRIASYASQFVGNPYVAGGSSLTNGADCSGFVWRVYKDFGYNVPRQSFSFRSAGTGVDFENAQPGDVICYAGHVGIYIGNGYIVHASTERTGIKFSRATYKTILAVRRLV
jgi:cell wall-associated NlpC family hydrolase